MRFGISTAQQHCTWDQLVPVWQAADDHPAFSSGWLFDHFYPLFTNTDGPCLEGWTALAALAQATTRLRLGLMVTGMVYRHPAVLANMAVTVDQISHGRLELGVGAAWNDEECDAYGIELGSMRQRFDRFEEGLQVLVGLLTQITTTFAGEHYNLTDARCEPKAVQAPHPPILIGGGGERRTLPLVARYAQHWNYPGNSEDPFGDLTHKRRVLADACAAIGRDPAEITVSTQIWARNSTPEQVAERATRYAELGVDIGCISMPRPLDPDDVARYGDALLPLTLG